MWLVKILKSLTYLAENQVKMWMSGVGTSFVNAHCRGFFSYIKYDGSSVASVNYLYYRFRKWATNEVNLPSDFHRRKQPHGEINNWKGNFYLTVKKLRFEHTWSCLEFRLIVFCVKKMKPWNTSGVKYILVQRSKQHFKRNLK